MIRPSGIGSASDRAWTNPGKESIDKIADELKTTMTINCGVFRDGEKLQIALQDIKRLQERFAHAPIRDKSSRFNTDVLGALETEHLLDFSEVIVAGAIARTECRGAHWRTDHPARDDRELAQAHAGAQAGRRRTAEAGLQAGEHQLREVSAAGEKILMSNE